MRRSGADIAGRKRGRRAGNVGGEESDCYQDFLFNPLGSQPAEGPRSEGFGTRGWLKCSSQNKGFDIVNVFSAQLANHKSKSSPVRASEIPLIITVSIL